MWSCVYERSAVCTRVRAPRWDAGQAPARGEHKLHVEALSLRWLIINCIRRSCSDARPSFPLSLRHVRCLCQMRVKIKGNSHLAQASKLDLY